MMLEKMSSHCRHGNVSLLSLMEAMLAGETYHGCLGGIGATVGHVRNK